LKLPAQSYVVARSPSRLTTLAIPAVKAAYRHAWMVRLSALANLKTPPAFFLMFFTFGHGRIAHTYLPILSSRLLSSRRMGIAVAIIPAAWWPFIF
jgi:hypothetical protein